MQSGLTVTIPSLPVQVWDLTFAAMDPSAACPGASAWRGLLGHGLRARACQGVEKDTCREGAGQGSDPEQGCLYTQIFDPRPVALAGVASQAETAPPPPYALAAWPAGPGRCLVRLCLVGSVAIAAALVLHQILAEGAHQGLGEARRAWTLIASHRVTAPAPAQAADTPTLHFLTPLRLRQRGDLMTPDRLAPRPLVMAAARRLTQLGSLYGSGPVDTDFRALAALLDADVRVTQRRLRWQEVTRRSARQGGEVMKTGGIVGSVTLYLGPHGSSVLPLLALAQQVGIGRNTTLGCGQICLLPAGASAVSPAMNFPVMKEEAV